MARIFHSKLLFETILCSWVSSFRQFHSQELQLTDLTNRRHSSLGCKGLSSSLDILESFDKFLKHKSGRGWRPSRVLGLISRSWRRPWWVQCWRLLVAWGENLPRGWKWLVVWGVNLLQAERQSSHSALTCARFQFEECYDLIFHFPIRTTDSKLLIV